MSFFAKASEKISTPPAHTTREPSRVWKPVTKPKALPAQRPSPPFSAASTAEAAPASSIESVAKLSGGALRIGKRRGLFPSACGTPENHTGEMSEEMKVCVLGTSTGMIVAGPFLSGKCETRGVPGGGRIRLNSDARRLRDVCLGERAIKRLVSCDSRVMSSCGNKSLGRAKERLSAPVCYTVMQASLLVSGANRTT